VWGAKLWRVLHTVGERNPAALETITAALATSLPCPDCDQHYNAWYVAHPPAGVAASKWYLDLHNNVNQRTGKTLWTAEQVTAEYATEESLTAAREALTGLAGIIGSSAHTALTDALA
jgi:hypothetical protein